MIDTTIKSGFYYLLRPCWRRPARNDANRHPLASLGPLRGYREPIPLDGEFDAISYLRRCAPPRGCFAASWGPPRKARLNAFLPALNGRSLRSKKHLAAFHLADGLTPPKPVGCWGSLKSRPCCAGSTFPGFGSPRLISPGARCARPG